MRGPALLLFGGKERLAVAAAQQEDEASRSCPAVQPCLPGQDELVTRNVRRIEADMVRCPGSGVEFSVDEPPPGGDLIPDLDHPVVAVEVPAVRVVCGEAASWPCCDAEVPVERRRQHR